MSYGYGMVSAAPSRAAMIAAWTLSLSLVAFEQGMGMMGMRMGMMVRVPGRIFFGICRKHLIRTITCACVSTTVRRG